MRPLPIQSSNSRRSDVQLWAVALALSLLINGGIFASVGIAALRISSREAAQKVLAPKPIPQADVTVEIFAAEPAKASAAAAPSPPARSHLKKPFARTSPDQATTTPEKNAEFIGENDTLATSDRTPDPAAPPLPAQAGETPRDADELETTSSDYQDGNLTSSGDSQAPAPEPEPVASAPAKPAVASSEKLLEGPNPVDVSAPEKTDEAIPQKTPDKPAPEDFLKETNPPANEPKEAKENPKKIEEQPKPKPASSDAPAFKGNQRKTAIVGSISRTGKSALSVENSPLGRYQATICRAVELEWQRNCVRHRDFITPGFLTVRCLVEPNGKVRSVQFIGEMETGEVQKGFTLNSIRDAPIPPMPPAIRKDYEKNPLELIFNFYF